MTKISLYPNISTPTLDDVLIGTDIENANETMNFTIQSIVDLAIPYQIYNAILTQSGVSNPVATVLQNTLNGTVVWTRSEEGVYLGTLAGAFNPVKTLVQASSSTRKLTEIANYSSNFVEITNRSITTGSPADGITKMSVEIKVYA